VIGAILVVGLPSSGPAAAATKQEIVRALGVDRVSADYIVLVDNSGSVSDRGLRPQLRRAFGALLRALRPQDHLTLVLFAGEPKLVWDDRVGHDQPAIARALDAAPRPDTDIGAAIAQALQTLERSGASSVATVILLTDGKHTPPPDSQFAGTTGPAWTQLADRVTRLPRRLRLSAYAIALAPDTDARLLRQVFGATTSVVSTPVSQLASLFVGRVRGQVETAKLEQALANDSGAVLRFIWPRRRLEDLAAEGDDVSVKLRLRSTAREMPLRVRDLRVTASGIDVLATGPSRSIVLAPGASTAVTLHLRYTGADPGGLPLIRRTMRRSGTLRATATLGTPWDDVLEDEFGVRPPQPRLQNSVVPVGITIRRGISWVLLAAALGVLGVAGIVLRRRRRAANPTLVGLVDLIGPEAGRVAIDLTTAGRRLAVGPGEDVQIGGAKGAILGRRTTADGIETPAIEIRLRTDAGKVRRTLTDGDSQLVGDHTLTYSAS
jgi:hypothetical protein